MSVFDDFKLGTATIEKGEGIFDGFLMPEKPDTLTDPLKQEQQVKETVDIADELSLSIPDVNSFYVSLSAKPYKFRQPFAGMSITSVTPTKWEKFKNFFTSQRPPLPPDADRAEKIARAVDIGLTLPLRAFVKFTKGMNLGVPDLMWAAIKRITPDDMWEDEVKNMNLDEAMDWAGGYNPSGFQKTVGEIAEFIGRLVTIAPLAQTAGILGNTPQDITVLIKAQETAKLFGFAAITEQIAKYAAIEIDPTETEYGYEGPKAVLRDMAIGAVFSLIRSGIKGAWSKLTPNEYDRAFKLLGLKKDASTNEIKAAARNLARKYHPDKVEGFREEFEKVIKARDLLIKGEPQDIVFRGQKVVYKPKMLTGETAEQYAERIDALAKGERAEMRKPAPKERKVYVPKPGELEEIRKPVRAEKAVPAIKAEQRTKLEEELKDLQKEREKTLKLIAESEELGAPPEMVAPAKRALAEAERRINDIEQQLQVAEAAPVEVKPKVEVAPAEVKPKIEPITKAEREQLRDMGMTEEEIGKTSADELRRKLADTMPSIRMETPPIGDREAGYIDLTPLADAGKQVKTTAEIAAKLVTRFGGLEPEVQKVLIEYEEQMRELPKVIAEESISNYGHLTPEQENAIRSYRELPARYPRPEGLDVEYAQYERDIDEIGRGLEELGYTADWPNRYREKLEKKLAKAESREEIDPYEIELLQEAIEEARDLQYLHHYYKKPSTTKQISNWFRSKRISSRPSGLLGREIPTYEKARELGLEPAPLAVEVAHMKYCLRRAQEADKLIQAINRNPNLSAWAEEAPADWEYLDENIFPASVQHQAWVSDEGKPVHKKRRRKYPVPIKQALEELTYARNHHALIDVYDRTNFALKMIGFYNPLVMSKNDLFQGWRAAGIKHSIYLPKATKIFLEKGEEYEKLRKAGLFNNVVNWTPSVTDLTQKMLDDIRMSHGEKVMSIAKQYLNPFNIIENIRNLNEMTTWNIDEIMRIACYEAIKDTPMTEGMTDFAVVELANDFMVNYAKLPKATKEHLTRAFFVPTYRIGNFRVWFDKIMAHPWRYKGPLLRTVGYKMFIYFGMPVLAASFIEWMTGKKRENIRTEKGYRIVIPNPDTGKDTVYSLSDPLLEGAKLTQRDIRFSLKANLAAVPSLMYRLMAGQQYKETKDPYGEFFKLGTPIYRDVVNWDDPDKTIPQKIMTQLAIAYVYTRKMRPTEEDKKISARSLAKALSIWRDWKYAKLMTTKQIENEIKFRTTKSGKPHKDYEDRVDTLRRELKNRQRSK